MEERKDISDVQMNALEDPAERNEQHDPVQIINAPNDAGEMNTLEDCDSGVYGSEVDSPSLSSLSTHSSTEHGMGSLGAKSRTDHGPGSSVRKDELPNTG